MTDTNKSCPICKLGNVRRRQSDRAAVIVDCPRCGGFLLSEQLLSGEFEHTNLSEKDIDLLPYLSAYTRQSSERGLRPELTTENWREFAKAHKGSSVSQKISMLLKLIASRSHPAEKVRFDADLDYPLLDAHSAEEVYHYLQHLVEFGDLEIDAPAGVKHPSYIVTVKGWRGLERTIGEGVETERDIVFISCGQFSKEEKELGNAVAKLVDELTPFRGYFAQNQTSFEALSQHIFGALNRCVGFIGIMHHRGTVSTLNDQLTRGSVWIEQEIAIAAFLTQALGRQLRVAFFIQEDIALEGVRQTIPLNPRRFKSNDEVLEHLRKILRTWSPISRPAPDKPVGLQLDATLSYEEVRITGVRHDYRLIVTVINTGSEKANEYRVDVEFPSALLPPHAVYGNEVQEKKTRTHRFFRTTARNHSDKELYPTDSLTVMTLDYFVDDEIFSSGLLEKEKARVMVYSGNMSPRKIEKSMMELNKF